MKIASWETIIRREDTTITLVYYGNEDVRIQNRSDLDDSVVHVPLHALKKFLEMIE